MDEQTTKQDPKKQKVYYVSSEDETTHKTLQLQDI